MYFSNSLIKVFSFLLAILNFFLYHIPLALCLNYIYHVRYVSQPCFRNQPFRGALVNRKSAYFGRGCCDGCFCIKMLFLTIFFYVIPDCVLNYMFLKEKCKKEICFTIAKFNIFNPFCSQRTISLPPENIRKLKNIFWCFHGVGEECLGIGF